MNWNKVLTPPSRRGQPRRSNNETLPKENRRGRGGQSSCFTQGSDLPRCALFYERGCQDKYLLVAAPPGPRDVVAASPMLR